MKQRADSIFIHTSPQVIRATQLDRVFQFDQLFSVSCSLQEVISQ